MADLNDITAYNYQKEVAVLDIGTTFQEVVTMTTPVLPAATYEISYSFEMVKRVGSL